MSFSNKVALLRDLMDGLYKKYNRKEFIKTDPLMFVYDYENDHDREIAAFFASALAYGRVASIQSTVKKLLSLMGDSPHSFIMGYNDTKKGVFSGFKYRFNTEQDIDQLCKMLKWTIKKYGSIENLFAQGLVDKDVTVVNAISKFSSTLLDYHASINDGNIRRGVTYLLADPKRGSACKRMNMYLRWMVRNDSVDPGTWKSIDPSKLIIPMDVHLSRICGMLGLHQDKNISIRSALKVTDFFRTINPKDPAKYDFSLCRIGIVEGCTGKQSLACKNCVLNGVCSRK